MYCTRLFCSYRGHVNVRFTVGLPQVLLGCSPRFTSLPTRSNHTSASLTLTLSLVEEVQVRITASPRKIEVQKASGFQTHLELQNEFRVLGDTVADLLGLEVATGGGESVELSESSASFGLSIELPGKVRDCTRIAETIDTPTGI